MIDGIISGVYHKKINQAPIAHKIIYLSCGKNILYGNNAQNYLHPHNNLCTEGSAALPPTSIKTNDLIVKKMYIHALVTNHLYFMVLPILNSKTNHLIRNRSCIKHIHFCAHAFV